MRLWNSRLISHGFPALPPSRRGGNVVPTQPFQTGHQNSPSQTEEDDCPRGGRQGDPVFSSSVLAPAAPAPWSGTAARLQLCWSG